jgi:tRNA(fMet)-specific endonuclease VapC
MKEVMLDTVAISALGDQSVDLFEVLAEVVECYVPVIVLGEYRHGLLNSKRRRELEPWLEEVEATLTILVPTGDTARIYANTIESLRKAGRKIPTNDVWISSLALEHNLPVLTRDRHFDWVPGLQRVEW